MTQRQPPPHRAFHLKQGQSAEDVALAYLKQQGLTLRCRNYRTQLGEIDLIMEDPPYWVFVEVRWRQHCRYGGPLSSITYPKQRKLIHTAQCYLKRHKACYTAPCRFDVVAISPRQTPPVQWIKNAF